MDSISNPSFSLSSVASSTMTHVFYLNQITVSNNP